MAEKTSPIPDSSQTISVLGHPKRHTPTRRTNSVLKIEVGGFCSLIGLSWLNELTNFQHFFFSDSHSNWHGSLLETLVILLVAVPILVMTKRIVDRLYFMEGLLSICAWCRRLDCEGNWVPLEKYFDQQFSQQSTHGICPDCYEKQKQTAS